MYCGEPTLSIQLHNGGGVAVTETPFTLLQETIV